MPLYKYRAYSEADPGNPIANEVEADSRSAVASMLLATGLTPISVEEVESKSRLSLDKQINFRIGKAVKTQELAMFTDQLSIMIEARVGIPESLATARGNSRNKRLTEPVLEIERAVQQGSSLSEAMAQYPKIFDNVYVALVAAGETGSLGAALSRIAKMLHQQAANNREVRSAMAYPLGVFLFSGIICLGLMIFIVPKFEDIFKQVGGELPAPTRLLINVSGLVQTYWYILPLLFGGIYYAWNKWRHSASGALVWDGWKLNFRPMIGSVNRKIVTARFFRTLSTLRENRVDDITSVQTAAPTVNNAVVEAELERSIEALMNGVPISKAFADIGMFPDMSMAMLEAGLKAGEVGSMLTKVAEVYEDEVAASVKSMKSLLEPLAMVVVGVMVGSVVLALYLPMFSIYDQFH